MTIICAKCKKPVERIEHYHDPATMTTKIRVYCHGDIDNGEIDDFTAKSMTDRRQIIRRPQLAFRTERLHA